MALRTRNVPHPCQRLEGIAALRVFAPAHLSLGENPPCSGVCQLSPAADKSDLVLPLDGHAVREVTGRLTNARSKSGCGPMH